MPEDFSLRHTLARFCVLLLVTQLVRAAFAWIFSVPLHLEWKIVSPLSIFLMGVFFLAVTRPSASQLGLDLSDTSKTSRWIHLAAGLILCTMLVVSIWIDPSLWLENLNGILVTPIVEEIIFRGLGWTKISRSLQQKNNQLLTWVIVSVLFGIWHLFYADVLLWYAPMRPSLSGLPTALLWKVLIGGFIGGAAGLLRWKTKHLPAAIYTHALFNLFGR